MTRAVRRPAPPVPHIADTLQFEPLPATVVALYRLDPGTTVSLHREEERLLRTLSPGRQPHFIVGRMAAARALRALGADGPVLRDGPRPAFPNGVRGSISHCVGPIGACLASTHPRVIAVGTDLERTDRLSWDAARLVCTPHEYDWARRARRPESRLAVVFSAKEAVYKALSALEVPEPVFHDVQLRVARGRLYAHVAPGLLPKGRQILGWVRLLPGGHVITSVAVLSADEAGKGIPLSIASSEVI